MNAILTSTIRDPRSGKVHKMGEPVYVSGAIKDQLRGVMYTVEYQDETKGIVLPDDVKEV